MRWIVIVVLLFSIGVSAAEEEPTKYSIGGGIEARFDRDVNPDYGQVDSLGLVFISAAKHPWSALWELNNNQNASNEGNYSVRTTAFNTMLWGRYEPWSYLPISPYGGLGIGWNFQNVVSRFGSAVDNRWASGGAMAGVALGIMSDFWQHWKVEAEVHLVKLEFESQPAPSFVLRTGYTF